MYLIIRISHKPGADPGFLEKGFIFIKVWGVHLADFVSFFLKYPMKIK